MKISLLVLGAALMHATWNALVKTGADRIVTMTVIGLVWSAAGGMGGLLSPPPLPASWGFLALSVAIHHLYLIGLILMYRTGDLSHVYPIARGSPLLVLAGLSTLVIGEVLAPLQLAGVAVISLGILSLALDRGKRAREALQREHHRRRHNKSLLYALLTGAFIVGYTLCDGVGVRRSGSPHGYAAWLFFFQGLPWAALLAWIRLRRPARLPKPTVWSGLLAGVLSMTAYWAVIWAFNLAPVAPIAALRETGVIFAALIGTIVLREPFGRRRVLAAFSVAAGVALLNLPS